MRFDVITIMPQIFNSVFSVGLIHKAIKDGLININIHNLREYAKDKHKMVDDVSYGGGAGMVFKPEPIFEAVENIRINNSCIILLSAQGKLYNQKIANELLKYEQIILICCRYEGCDERVSEHLADMELSIGDYILHGGEIASMVIIESISRLIPGVVGKEESIIEESFASFLLDYPHYTRPEAYKGYTVPKILLSGNHRKIKKWRLEKAFEKTIKNRPDLIMKELISNNGKELLNYFQVLLQE